MTQYFYPLGFKRTCEEAAELLAEALTGAAHLEQYPECAMAALEALQLSQVRSLPPLQSVVQTTVRLLERIDSLLMLSCQLADENSEAADSIDEAVARIASIAKQVLLTISKKLTSTDA